MQIFTIEVKKGTPNSVKEILWDGTPEGKEAFVVKVKAKTLRGAIASLTTTTVV